MFSTRFCVYYRLIKSKRHKLYSTFSNNLHKKSAHPIGYSHKSELIMKNVNTL